MEKKECRRTRGKGSIEVRSKSVEVDFNQLVVANKLEGERVGFERETKVERRRELKKGQ